jgi:hypothetical protein
MIRIGKRIYTRSGSFVDPNYEDYEQIIIMTKSYKKYYALSPYSLKDDNGHLLENTWQFSKVYKNVPYTKSNYSRYDNRVIWKHDAEQHIDENGLLNDNYWNWREKGLKCKDAIRYPVGFKHRHKCLYSIKEGKDEYTTTSQKLTYIEGRKAIYLPLYIELAKKTKEFKLLQEKLENNKNLLIIEVDGPHQESLPYYKKKYSVNDDFIKESTILATEENMNIMLNDDKHAFGHGYCLAMTLLDLKVN